MKKILIISPAIIDINYIITAILENGDRHFWADEKSAFDNFAKEKPEMVIFMGILHLYNKEISGQSEVILFNAITARLEPQQKMQLVAYEYQRDIYKFKNFTALPLVNDKLNEILRS